MAQQDLFQCDVERDTTMCIAYFQVARLKDGVFVLVDVQVQPSSARFFWLAWTVEAMALEGRPGSRRSCPSRFTDEVTDGSVADSKEPR